MTVDQNARTTDPTLSPVLTDEQWQRLLDAAQPEDVEAGQHLFDSGDRDFPMILVESGEVELVRDPLAWSDEVVVAILGERSFTGDLAVLNGHASFLSARAAGAARIRRLGRTELRRVMDEDDALGDVILRALWARREFMRQGAAALTLKLVGRSASTDFLKLRRFAERLDLAFTTFELDDDEACRQHNYTLADLPVAYIQGVPILQATPGAVADRLGLSYQPTGDEIVDLVVIGAGPAGLAGAIYGASEGLSTVLLDAVAPGGQAASTSRIENFLGFPFGVSGERLTGQASLQAVKFGVRVCAPCEAVALRTVDGGVEVTLSDGVVVTARSALVTSGAAYRRLVLERWDHFERSSIYYAATPMEAKQVAGRPVVVVGGANSAGQAALFLSSYGSTVHLVVRGDDLASRMSTYLASRIAEDANIHVHLGSQVTGLHGGKLLESVEIDKAGEVDAQGLFCFVGAEPASAWARDLDLDEAGFILTGQDVAATDRERLPFETSIARVFAAGDVRHGSMKRVAAAVGEGSSAVASIHRVLAD